MFYKYLRYLIRHKWFVFTMGLGLPHVGIWQLLVHDWSKFLPSEFGPYMRFFNGPHTRNPRSPSEARVAAPPEVADAFDVAWLLHQNRNPHHWQFWVLLKDDGGQTALKMPPIYFWEMIADWRGAGMAAGFPDTAKWYMKNRNNMILHADTRNDVEAFLRVRN